MIFEAPQREQQAWLLHRFGSSCNLGNIAPDDVLSLETLRLGSALGDGRALRAGRRAAGRLTAGTGRAGARIVFAPLVLARFAAFIVTQRLQAHTDAGASSSS